MTKRTEALKLALEALENAEDQLAKPYSTGARYAITALREALASEAKEQPAQRTWVGLTQDEFRDFASTCEYGTGGLIRAIEAKLKEKNT